MPILTCPSCGAKNRVDERAQQRRPVCGKCGAKLMDTHPLEVTDRSFAKAVLGVKEIPVLLDCWAPWCGPCRMMTPILNDLARSAAGRYVIAKLNVDENPRVAGQFRISSIPALLIFKNGRLVDQMVGVQKAQAITARLMRQGGVAV
jgi:thioredoxin 2